MSHILEIIEIGNPILRQHAKSIENFSDQALQTLIDNMITTLDQGGVGLAAPQVSESIRLFVMHIRPTVNRPDLPDMGYQIIINPEITEYSSDIEESREGCLSIPGPTRTEGLRGIVPRSRTIRVSYQNRNGEHIEETMEGVQARVFQHEFDHLNGLFFTDRMTDMLSLSTTKEWKKRK